VPFTNCTKVVLTDNEQYTFEQLIKLKDLTFREGSPPADKLYVMKGYGVSKSGLIVEQVFHMPAKVDHGRVLQLRLSTGDVVETTPEQEFFLELGIPTQAKDLEVGHRPLVQMGGEIEIKHIEWVNGTQDVFHLTAEAGNYMLASGLLVADASV
jgi:intein/homing endonuclease